MLLRTMTLKGRNEMTTLLKISTITLVVTAGSAFAKAHDQGIADGDFPAISTGEVVQDVIDGPGISAVVSYGARGESASAAGGDNRVVPVVGSDK